MLYFFLYSYTKAVNVLYLSLNKQYATNILENWSEIQESFVDRSVEIREIHEEKYLADFAIQFALIVDSYEILIASDSDRFLPIVRIYVIMIEV